jgi:hypothetical protein
MSVFIHTLSMSYNISDLNFSVSADTQSIEKRVFFENVNTTLTREVTVRIGTRQCTEFTTYFQVIIFNHNSFVTIDTLHPYTIIKEQYRGPV